MKISIVSTEFIMGDLYSCPGDSIWLRSIKLPRNLDVRCKLLKDHGHYKDSAI